MYVDIEEAYFLLSRSQPLAIPTETVWGLAARLEDEKGVQEIFRIKNRPPKNPLIIHIGSIESLKSYASCVPDDLELLTHEFWPGGLTLALPVYGEKVPSIVRAGLPSAAFRMPDNPTTLALLKRIGPLVAPSANLSGKPSATCAAHIEEDFGTDFPILYSPIEPCASGIESTILIWRGGEWRLGRSGAISLSDIEKVLGYVPSSLTPEGGDPLCPGQLFRHYAPKAKLVLQTIPWEKSLAQQYDGVLGFDDRVYEGARVSVSMGSARDVLSVSKRLYAALRELDERNLAYVFVDMNIPQTLAWAPIHDRLLKASTE